MKNKSVNASKIDWGEVKQTALAKANGIENPYNLGPVMRYLFEAVGDFHGAFFYRDSMFRWQKNHHIVSDSIMNEWKKGEKIKTGLLAGNIGYLRIPIMLIRKEEEFNTKAQSLNDSLCKLLSNSIKGLVLDLRLNGGGAMHPMILGVQNLLPSGKVGSFHSKKKENWFLKNNSFMVDTAVISKIVPNCTLNAQSIPVVILTSHETGSSGEFLIMAFKGRRNTILLGTTTAGFVTANDGFQINNESSMNLAIGYGADKNENIYRQTIKPDIYVDTPDSFNDLNKDLKVKAAVNWIKKHRK